MEFEHGPLPGTWYVRLKRFDDARGNFVKTFGKTPFGTVGITVEMHEEFYSVSHAGVIRGMHFQLPPHDHEKIVFCAQGAVEDVLLDLRRGAGYGRAVSVALSSDTPQLLYIPKGIAHGFEALTDNSLMVYKTSTEYAPTHDRGIRWDSFGHPWKSQSPIISERDRNHPALTEFVSPF